MSRPRSLRLLRTRVGALACASLVAAVAGGCGGEVTVPKEQTSLNRGAVLFNQRCSGCHTIDSANSYGSKAEGQLQPGERTNGPNFNTRKVAREDALFAIRNGGFSGAIMPANIVTGKDAELVADFLGKYSGRKKGSSGDVMGSGEQSE